MNINKINDMLEFWHKKYERPTLTQTYQGTNFHTILIFPSTNLLLKNYYKIEIKNIKKYYFIAMYEDDDNLTIIGIYDLDKQNLVSFDETGISFGFDEIITDKWMNLLEFKQYIERTKKINDRLSLWHASDEIPETEDLLLIIPKYINKTYKDRYTTSNIYFIGRINKSHIFNVRDNESIILIGGGNSNFCLNERFNSWYNMVRKWSYLYEVKGILE